MNHKESGTDDPNLNPTQEESEEDFAAESRVEEADEDGSVSEVSDMDHQTPGNGADAVPEAPGDNNEERPVDYGGA